MTQIQTAQTPQHSPGIPEVQLAPSVDAGQVVLLIVYLILIIVGAYYLTRYIANRRMRQGMRHSTGKYGGVKFSSSDPGHMVCVVDRIAIDREKTLMVVEFEGNYYLVGTTAQDMRLLGTAKARESAPGTEPSQSAEMAQEHGSEPEETFGQRFRRAFSIVLQSYLPERMRHRTAHNETSDSDSTRQQPEAPQNSSFEAEMRARIRPDEDDAGGREDRKN